jgi:hypothetical protein
VEEAAKNQGFFDEADDEKIALTGDELDNIINSADFTEETGAEAIVDDITPDEKLLQLQEEGIVPITPAPEDTSYLEDELNAAQELANNSEETAVAVESSEDISFDISDAIIEEPDLSAQLNAGSLEEPAPSSFPDISIDDISLDDISFDDLQEELDESDSSSEEDEQGEEPLIELQQPEQAKAPQTATEPEQAKAPQAATEPEREKAPQTATEPEAVEISIPEGLREELKTVLSYMDQLLEALPESKIEEFAKSKYFDTYKKLFAELGLA